MLTFQCLCWMLSAMNQANEICIDTIPSLMAFQCAIK